MTSNELRQGNLISFFNGLGKDEVIEVTPRFFSSLASGQSFEDQKKRVEINGYYKPIPLTEEWLLKFGFNKWTFTNHLSGLAYEDIFAYEKSGLIIHMADKAAYFKNEMVNKNQLSIVIHLGFTESNKIKYYTQTIDETQVDYVHQLQNLHFALTQTELEIK